MTENPQKENGHVDIANELVEALARINLSPYESRFLWCVFRKTYGWQKKEDWISLSQIAEMTGMHTSHASRAKKLLILRNIVTPRGNKIGFNKFYSQWKELPHGVNNHAKVTPKGNKHAPLGNLPTPHGVIQGLPHGAIQKTMLTKDNSYKRKGAKKNEDTNDDDLQTLKEKFIPLAVEFSDEHYAAKTWDQGLNLAADHRQNLFRKMRVFTNSRNNPPFAKKMFAEIAGYVNDFGAMKHHIPLRSQDDSE